MLIKRRKVNKQSQVFADNRNSTKKGSAIPSSSPRLRTAFAKNQSKIPKSISPSKKKQIISKKYSIVLIDLVRQEIVGKIIVTLSIFLPIPVWSKSCLVKHAERVS